LSNKLLCFAKLQAKNAKYFQQRVIAGFARAIAGSARAIAVSARAIASFARAIAIFARAIAVSARVIADFARAIAGFARVLAVSARAIAVSARAIAIPPAAYPRHGKTSKKPQKAVNLPEKEVKRLCPAGGWHWGQAPVPVPDEVKIASCYCFVQTASLPGFDVVYVPMPP
jgi:hypothetical protein